MFKFIFLTIVPHQTHRICIVALNSRITLYNIATMCIFDVFQDCFLNRGIYVIVKIGISIQ